MTSLRSVSRWGLRSVTAAAGLLLVGTATLTGLHHWTHSVASDRIYAAGAAPKRPVGLVLGAEVYPNGSPSPFLKARLDLAADLYAADRVEVLIVSGDGTSAANDEPAAMRRYLMSVGVPGERIVQDPAGFDTYDSCVRAQRVYGVDELTIISQTYHLPRALAICHTIGLEAVAVGDESVKAGHTRTWRYGVRREVLANVKAGYDLLTQRSPQLGAPETLVQEALIAAHT